MVVAVFGAAVLVAIVCFDDFRQPYMVVVNLVVNSYLDDSRAPYMVVAYFAVAVYFAVALYLAVIAKWPAVAVAAVRFEAPA